MAQRRAQLVALVVAAAWMSPRAAKGADPDSLACIHAAEDGQAARDRGEYLKAREILATCTAGACPGIIRRDCSTWLEDVRAATPSIVVIARDAAGRDLTSATLMVDGATRSLDGSAIELDPGPHVVRLEGVGITEEHIVVTAGEKQRSITLTIPQKSGAPNLVVVPAPQARDEKSVETPHVPAGSYVLGGLGVAGLATFGVFGFMGMSDADHLRDTCAPGCNPPDVDAVRTKLIVADVGLGVGVVALAAATWLAIHGLSQHRTSVADFLPTPERARSTPAAFAISF